VSIVLEKIVKRFDGHVVVDECSLEVADRELFVLLGASGSGKSTVLRMIAGLTPLDGGKVLLHGRRVDGLPPQERGTGFVFQNYSLFRHMNVAENIEFGLRIRGRPREERARRRDELLEVIGLSGLGERYPSQLSGGQMQRVALARALAYEPAVLLLDEPFGALDVKIRAQLRQSVKAIQRTLGVTTILVTHDQDEAFELGDRIGVMERGRLLEVGRPEELYRAPRTEYVATFLGSGNVLSGRVEGGKIRLGSVRLDLPPYATEIPPGNAVSILCRPEEVSVTTAAPPPDAAAIGSARVVDKVFVGSAERVFLRCDGLRGAQGAAASSTLPGEGLVLQALVRPEGGAATATRIGDVVQVALRSYHVFRHPGMRVLTFAGALSRSEDEAAVEFGLALASAVDGPVTLLGVVDDPGEERAVRGALDTVSARERDRKSSPTVVVRRGDAVEEVVSEIAERPYEICVLGASGGAGAARLAARIVGEQRIPAVIVPAGRPSLRRILICTSVGEPGKSDIELGGRIARRAGAMVTILHVRPGERREADLVGDSPALRGEVRPAAATLERGPATLGGPTLSGELKIRYGSVVEEVLEEARSGDHDLIVIGAHAAAGGRSAAGPLAPAPLLDSAHAVVARARRPVMIVPLRAM
jgi:sulfate transport system ATP-binding protein